MSTNILWGVNFNGTAGSAWSTGSTHTAKDETVVDSVNTPPHTFGFPWRAQRIYHDTQYGAILPIRDSGATNHAAGTTLFITVGKGYYAQCAVVGSTVNSKNVFSEAQWITFLDALLGFGANALVYTGGAAQTVYLDIEHEFDQAAKSSFGSAADYKAYYIRVWTLYQARLAARGITKGTAADRVRFGWCPTEYALRTYNSAAANPDTSCIAGPFWPGNTYVDVVMSDPYNSAGWASGTAFAPGQWTSFQDRVATTVQWAADHGNKPVAIGETDTVEWDWSNSGPGPTYDATRSAQWFTDAATYLNSQSRIFAVCVFVQGTNNQGQNYRFDWAFNNLKHEALRQAILATASGGTQGTPSAASGLTPVSSADGTSITLTWSAPPGGDNVTGWDVFIAPATQTSFGSKSNTSTLAVTPRSFTFTGLTPGVAYKMQVVAINSAGRSGFVNPSPTLTTSVPLANGAPTITAVTSALHAGTINTIDFSVTFNDAQGQPCTVTLDPGDGSAVVTLATNHSVPATLTAQHVYTATGSYQAIVTVTDNGSPPLSSSSQTVASVDFGDGTTAGQNWPTFNGLTWANLRTRLQAWQNQVDTVVTKNANKTTIGGSNRTYGLIGSTFDVASISGSAFVPVSGNLYYTRVILGDDGISGLAVITSAAQSGSGAVAAVFSLDGNTMYGSVSGSVIDTALQGTAGYTQIPLELNDSALTAGTEVVVAFLFPSGITTIAQFLKSVVSFSAYNGPITVTANTPYRGGVFTGKSTMPSTLTYSSSSTSAAVWVGVY